MHRSNFSTVVLYIVLVAVVLSPSVLPTHAVFEYLPTVVPGQFAQYMILNYSCQSAYLQICQSFETSLNDTTYAATEIIGVASPAVTLQLISVYKNGTGRQEGGLVNVETGASNITALSLGAYDYSVLAGGLAAHYRIWNTISAPTLNKTISETVVGSLRNVNFLNYTVLGLFMGVSYVQTFDLAFDESSGFLVELKSSLGTETPGILSLDFAIVMVDNNVWGNAHKPDFDLSANPTSVNNAASTSGNSTIILHRLNGFSATVSLSATSSSGISCSFSTNSLSMADSNTSTLSCRGSPGTYTVIVKGNGGYSVHDATVTFAVSATPTTTQPASDLPIPLIYGGIGLAAVIVALATLLFFRRKPSSAIVAPGDPSTPAVQP